MLNLYKIFNQKLSGRYTGNNASYSISFFNTKFAWYKLPLIKKMAKNNYPTLDEIIGIPSKSDQVKSDVILRVFINKAGDSACQTLKNVIGDITDPQERINLITPILEAFWIKTSNYEISQVDHIYIGPNKLDAINIKGKRVQDLEEDILEETFIIPTKNYIILFDLSVFNENEPGLKDIMSDYIKIIESIKLVSKDEE